MSGAILLASLNSHSILGKSARGESSNSAAFGIAAKVIVPIDGMYDL